MKTNGTRIILVAFFVYVMMVVFSYTASAQPDYIFKTGALQTAPATDKQVGARYLYTGVKPGINATVTITALSSGMTLTEVDGTSSGHLDAFQPVINVAANTNAYAEFKIDFTYSATGLPAIMAEVPVTCIDVDGRLISGKNVNEFDQVRVSGGYYVDYDMLGNELAVSYPTGYAMCKNISNIDYAGVDTVAKQVMFTVVLATTSSVTFRVGADNKTSATQQRLRSVYFKKFTYANSFLSTSALLAFRGLERNNKVELNWDLVSDHHIATVEIEKSVNGGNYRSIATVWTDASTKSFRYTDNETLTQGSCYRLKMIASNGAVQYSNIVAFKAGLAKATGVKMYPTVVRNSTTLQYTATSNNNIQFQVMDMSGRVVMQQSLNVNEGTNNIQINGMENLLPGQYVAVVNNGLERSSQSFVKQ